MTHQGMRVRLLLLLLLLACPRFAVADVTLTQRAASTEPLDRIARLKARAVGHAIRLDVIAPMRLCHSTFSDVRKDKTIAVVPATPSPDASAGGTCVFSLTISPVARGTWHVTLLNRSADVTVR